MEKIKAFMLGMMAMGVLMGFIWTSNEAYKEEVRAKANQAKHKEVNWYRVKPAQKQMANN